MIVSFIYLVHIDALVLCPLYLVYVYLVYVEALGLRLRRLDRSAERSEAIYVVG